MACPDYCFEGPGCIEVTLADLPVQESCAQSCSNYSGKYNVTQVGDFCRWLYTSGNVSIEITCENGYWWIVLDNALAIGVHCGVWSYPLVDAPTSPPLLDTAWTWVYGACEAVDSTCTTAAC